MTFLQALKEFSASCNLQETLLTYGGCNDRTVRKMNVENLDNFLGKRIPSARLTANSFNMKVCKEYLLF